MTRRPLLLGLTTFATLLAGSAGLLAPSQAIAVPPLPPTSAGVQKLLKAEPLPLALSDDFVFGKKKLFLYDPSSTLKTRDAMITAERKRLEYGAANYVERQTRFGHYYTFWWTAARSTTLTVRLEYRQQNLGAYVQAKEITCIAPQGKKQKSEFSIIGDEYLDDGKVIAWRALLIENGAVVALTQSALWQ